MTSILKRFERFFTLPTKIVFIFLFALLLGNFLPLSIKEAAYTFSVIVKAVLVFFLPFIVFSCIFSSILEMKKTGALIVILTILFSICISNFVSTLLAYGIGVGIAHSGWGITPLRSESTSLLQPMWVPLFSPWVSNDVALFSGILLGLIASIKKNTIVLHFSNRLRELSHFFLHRLFLPIVPLFVLGYTLKLQHENTLPIILKGYGHFLILVVLVKIVYLTFLYWVGAGFKINLCGKYIRTIFPPAVSAFSTMSSMATMPLTLEAAEQNTGNPKLSQMIIPMTVNNHLVGDSIFIPLISIILLIGVTGFPPQFGDYLVFAGHFVLAKFAVAAVPGGGIIVMIPILEKYLGMNMETLSLITALYILFDPIITAANVTGNGALAILLSKWIPKRETASE